MDISNPQVFDYIKSAEGDKLRVQRTPIGAWDMQANAFVIIPIDVSTMYPLMICAMIRNDADTGIFNLERSDASFTVNDGLLTFANPNVLLQRRAGGIFDSVDYNNTAGGYNRGWVTIWYPE